MPIFGGIAGVQAAGMQGTLEGQQRALQLSEYLQQLEDRRKQRQLAQSEFDFRKQTTADELKQRQQQIDAGGIEHGVMPAGTTYEDVGGPAEPPPTSVVPLPERVRDVSTPQGTARGEDIPPHLRPVTPTGHHRIAHLPGGATYDPTASLQGMVSEQRANDLATRLAEMERLQGMRNDAAATRQQAGIAAAAQRQQTAIASRPPKTAPRLPGGNAKAQQALASQVKLMEDAIPTLQLRAAKIRPAVIDALVSGGLKGRAGNMAATNEEQEFVTALMSGVAGALHQEAGARLNHDQLQVAKNRWIPMTGDSPQTVQVKIKNLIQKARDDRAILESGAGGALPATGGAGKGVTSGLGKFKGLEELPND